MAHYSIKDLEKLSGIKAHTLRIWEKRYNLVDPKRTHANIRYYNEDDLKRIINVALLNRNGIKISHLAGLDETAISGMILELAKDHPETTNQIDNLIMSMLELDEKKFEKALNKSINIKGFEETLLHLICPFFEKIGMLWQTGTINPAQEHFVSNLIRQKLIAAIDKLIENEKPGAQSFVMYLPEGELHEINLLFYYYLAKINGHKVVYLGQSVPFDDLSSVINIKPCDYILTSFGLGFSETVIHDHLLKLLHSFPKQKIFYSASTLEYTHNSFPENVIQVNNAIHFHEIIVKLQ